ncbi:glycosyltransferase [Amycolatopsis magusensis]|uniref:Sterol 3beta-glucosyltransferase n=1 Tax=Amycolatopsis magusensis TaxID=882444 RepID=A0ABS4Q5T1_9PSEU|nr:glycosyltransferase [Amycolatopsis magusensis]MBP2187042.1 sterol 3beta-glucosyltransferase [Amycolatopsis magusensis]
MDALLLTYGSQGDVQPFVALARALRAAGHGVRLAGPARSANLAGDLEYRPITDALIEAVDTDEVREARDSGKGAGAVARSLGAVKAAAREALDDSWAAAAEGADVVVHHPITAGNHVAEKLGVPSVLVSLFPTNVPTSEFPCATAPVRLPKALNRLTYRLDGLAGLALRGTIDDWRGSLGLPKRRGRHDFLHAPSGEHVTVLNAFSRHVVPPPADWPAAVHTTGYWFLPADPAWTPPAELTAFLAAGAPPVCVTFGSLVGADPARTARTVLAAVRAAGVRAVLVAGWGGLQVDQVPDDVLVVEQVPYDWLFPKVAAVVSHSGAGTSSAAAAAGRPQVGIPMDVEQPMWAARLHGLGVGPAPIPYGELAEDALAAALRAVTTEPEYARRAAELGALIEAEGGAAEAVAVLERRMS